MIDLFSYPSSPGSQNRDTSRAAAASIAKAAPLIRDQVLAQFERSAGMTADECAGRLGLSILTVRPRCSELAALGKIRDSGARRAVGNGQGRRKQTAIVWVPVYPAAIAGQRVG